MNNIILLIIIILNLLGIITFIINYVEKYTFKPVMKLKAYCISLKEKPQNLKYIKNEWKDFLNIHHFIALESCTKSHEELLIQIWKNKENESFPIVIMEDDVYRMKNFIHYWNAMFEIKNKNLDYITFDGIFLKFKKSQKNVHPKFVSLLEHRATGFTVFFKRFFDRFNSIEELTKHFTGVIDMNFTHNPMFNNWIPKRQVLRQIINKKSSTANINTNYYTKFYNKAQKILEDNFPIKNDL